MQGRIGIVWDDQKSKELSALVRRFNDKLRKAAKRNPDIAKFLPERKSVRQIKASLKTNAEYQQLKRDINLMFKRDALKLIRPYRGVVTTKYQSAVIRNATRRIAAARKKELKRLEKSPNFYGLTREQERQYSRPIFRGDTQSAWDAFVKSIERKSMSTYMGEYKSKYHENFIKALESTFGKERARSLAEIANKLPENYLYDIYYDNPNLSIDFVYGANEMATKYETVANELQRSLDNLYALGGFEE